MRRRTGGSRILLGLLGLLAGPVLTAADEASALVESDLSIHHGVFACELHAFDVFHGGAVQPPRRRQP